MDTPRHKYRTVSDNIYIGDTVKISSRHYLSSELLWSAHHNAHHCRSLENELVKIQDIDRDLAVATEHRACAMMSVLTAVAFLEALVNETFQDAADITYGTNSRIGPLSEQCRALMGEFWTASKEGERYIGVLDKYQMALLFAQKERFDKGANPYQNADYLIFLRNKLVHFRPAWHERGGPDEVEKKLASRFKPSALLTGTGNPWFPGKALGAGGAEWACASASSLADAWTERLGIPRTYEG